jgi:hypothetical protein
MNAEYDWTASLREPTDERSHPPQGRGMNPPGTALYRHRGVDVATLRQLDQWAAAPKGTAFRAFKRCQAGLVEERDFFVEPIDAPSDAAAAALIERLRADGRLYPSSHVAILLSRAACSRLPVMPGSDGR